MKSQLITQWKVMILDDENTDANAKNKDEKEKSILGVVKSISPF